MIAEKRIKGKIAFQVHRCLNPFEKETAIVKALSETDVEAEIKDWAEAGYLLAYGTSERDSFTYLILKINVPNPRPPYSQAEFAMRAAMPQEKLAINSDSDSESDKVK